MALREILTYPDPRLAVKSEAVGEVNEDIRTLVRDMFETMYQAEGVGLAAPQVGVHKRVIVLDCGDRSQDSDEAPLSPKDPLALINPVVLAGEGKIVWQEGCLSVPGFNDDVERFATVRVEALTPDGEPTVIHAEGLLAVCLQHEIDHLDGILFVDRLSRLKQSMAKKRLKRRAEEEVLA
jgi:peptide deformylase